MSKDFIDFFVQLLTVAFGVFAAGLVLFGLLWPKVENYLLRINAINQNREFTKEAQQLRFAAYERLLLFAHRIEPQALMVRNHQEQLSVDQFVRLLLAEVENEYQHNLTQQLYVSDSAWHFISDLKNNTLALIRNAKAALPQDAKVDQYVGVVLKHVQEFEQNPYTSVQLILKKELGV